jgi:hypothetical protein
MKMINVDSWWLQNEKSKDLEILTGFGSKLGLLGKKDSVDVWDHSS